MNLKKSIAGILSVALMSAGFCGITGNNSIGIFSCAKVSADSFVPYSLSVDVSKAPFVVLKGGTITVDDFINRGSRANETVGTYHDSESDELYGQVTQTNTQYSISLKDCTMTLPDELKEGENEVTFTYCPEDVDESFAVSYTDKFYVSFTEDPNDPNLIKYPQTDPQNQEPGTPSPSPRYGNVTFDLTDSVARPGETTYLDIKIGENSGFCTVLLQLLFDENVFSIKSISTTSDFTGNDYNLYYSSSFHKMIFMNNCIENIKGTDSSVIRVAFAVNKDAPEGDYTIGLGSDPSVGEAAGHLPDGEIGLIGITPLPGTITVSKTLAPKTNVSSMPLNRVYAEFKDDNTTLSKTGDTTGDGRINAMDAVKMVRYFTGVDEGINNADIDENGKLNVSDLIQLKNYITLG